MNNATLLDSATHRAASEGHIGSLRLECNSLLVVLRGTGIITFDVIHGTNYSESGQGCNHAYQT